LLPVILTESTGIFILLNITFQNSSFMQELIEKLRTEAGLTEDQAAKAITTIKTFVVEKFPMLEGAVNNIFGEE
jgi:hypothetical protein